MANKVVEDAKVLLNENPSLKYYKAKEMHKKDPQDCSPKGAK